MKHLLWKYKILLESIKYAVHSWKLTTKGQLPEYEILQLAHRLEKGLTQVAPKPLWGWEKADHLASLLKSCRGFANETGEAVLSCYLISKKESRDEKELERLAAFESKFGKINTNKQEAGGIFSVSKEDLFFNKNEIETIRRLFVTRHSIRDFSEEEVKRNDLMKAIELTMRAPSACNRQTTHLYVHKMDNLQSIILTGNIRAFTPDEFNDWVVSTSIFAGYLTLALHLYGIGSCIMRKQQYGHSSFNEMVRNKCNIPEEEMIVLEIRYGYYKSDNRVAISNRKSGNDVVSFVG